MPHTDEHVIPGSVICIGETMTQLAPPPGATLSETDLLTVNAAGAESTVAMYLARLGHAASWVSRVGADPFGGRILGMLRAFGVDVTDVYVDDHRPTGVYFKDPTPDGTRVFYYRAGSAASALSPDDVPWQRLDSSAIVHTSGITAALSTSTAAMVEALLAGRERHGHHVSFDVNHRPALWQDRDAARELLALARRADIVFVGLDEAEHLWGTATAAEVRALIPDPPELIVKDGALGATAFIRSAAVFEPTEPVDVVEPVGAGDSFAAGYLHELLRAGDLQQRLRTGHRLAAAVLRTTADFVDPEGTSHVAKR